MVRSFDDCLDERDRKVIEDVARVGWHVINIAAERGRPGWSFSIGLFQTFGQPEVVVFGLRSELGYRVINGIGVAIKAGRRFAVDGEYPDILADVRCLFKPVQRRWYEPFLGYARWYYEGDEFPVLQCIWPDKQQNYPWQPAFKAEWAWLQPFLFHENPVIARAADLLESLEESE